MIWDRNTSSNSRILIADDHGLIREAVCHILSSRGMDCTAAASVDDIMVQIKNGEVFDALVLDLNMPGSKGLSTALDLVSRDNFKKVLVLTAHVGLEMVDPLREAGVDGIAIKTVSLSALPSILELVLNGEKYFSSEIALAIQEQRRSLDVLNPLEERCLREVLAGKANKEIAFVMGIAESSVKMHMRSIFRKTGTKNRAQAAVFAEKMGISAVGDDEFGGKALLSTGSIGSRRTS